MSLRTTHSGMRAYCQKTVHPSKLQLVPDGEFIHGTVLQNI
jgi:hypothetical protein